MAQKKASPAVARAWWLAALLLIPAVAAAFQQNNRFRPGSFPARVDMTTFRLPLEAGEVLVVLPPGMTKDVPRLQRELADICGRKLDIREDGDVGQTDARGRHLIVVGNLQNNRWARRLYLRRLAFADAYFPGPGGVAVTPAVSPWNRARNIILVGYSREEDGPAALAEFLRLLPKGSREIGPLRFLKTPLAFPRPPANVDKTLAAITRDFVIFPPYREVFLWGLAYHLTGDPKWAGFFKAGCRALYERARKSGAWVSEPWTTLYFDLWRFFLVWGLLDGDPVFDGGDRAIVEELLWNYTRVLDGDDNFPHFRPDVMVEDEIRQNHTTFLALDLFCADRYYRDKYRLPGLEGLRAKYEPAMSAQVGAVHGNDDAGFGYWTNLVFGYIYLAPNHALLYKSLQGDEEYLAAPHLQKFADLLVTSTDNRRDGASFGDVSGYDHRVPGLPRGMTEKYLEIAAAAARDGAYHWIYEWLARDSGFELNNLFDGEYAIDAPAAAPARFTGVHPVFLDDAALRWVARRAGKPSFIPEETRRYVDKMSLRRSFEAADEYLLLDGTSTFAHGHQDGNTVVRLTWKDRIWLFDLDYINPTPRYHNGVVVTLDGRQEEPPPLTSLEAAADFREAGLTRTACRDWSGADWTRNIVWKKGEYFVFLDEVRARRAGEYRLDNRWRTRGDVTLEGTNLTVRQGGEQFRILGADGAPRRLTTEKEAYWNSWNYPWGDKELKVLDARVTKKMDPGERFAFANLMFATDGEPSRPVEFRRVGDSTFLIGDGGEFAAAGLEPAVLERAGVRTDAGLFLADSKTLRLAGAGFVASGESAIRGPAGFSLELDAATGRGTLVVSETGEGEFGLRNCAIEGGAGQGSRRPVPDPSAGPSTDGGERSIRLAAGTYALRLAPRAAGLAEFVGRLAAATSRPEIPAVPYLSPHGFVGLTAGAVTELEAPWTAWCVDGGAILLGDERGDVSRLQDGRLLPLWRSPGRRPSGVLLAADIDGDGAREILAADDAENLYCVSAAGAPLWTAKLTKYMGENANATDIAASPAGPGKPVVFVATNGFKLHAFDARGRLKWEGLVRYHRQTEVRAVEDAGRSYVAVGTVYSTPVNVFEASTGRPIWHTWDQMGDEVNSTTEYCGVCLTDMLFLDGDGDGRKEIVFGTKSNRVVALRVSDGSMVWQTNVGDEVRVLRSFVDPGSGEVRLAAGTEAGDVAILDRRGRRLGRIDLGTPVVGLEILAASGSRSTELLAATDDGRVFVFDGSLAVRAAGALGREIKAVAPLPDRDGRPCFLVLSEKMLQLISFINYSPRPSRVY